MMSRQNPIDIELSYLWQTAWWCLHKISVVVWQRSLWSLIHTI